MCCNSNELSHVARSDEEKRSEINGMTWDDQDRMIKRAHERGLECSVADRHTRDRCGCGPHLSLHVILMSVWHAPTGDQLMRRMACTLTFRV